MLTNNNQRTLDATDRVNPRAENFHEHIIEITESGGDHAETTFDIFVVPTEGAARGQVHQFFSAVPGSEVSGPMLTPDNSALFVSIQHPGEGGSFAEPLTRWPDGGAMPPRPTVLIIERGGEPDRAAATPTG
ncbi:MAG: alkaline phosphatase PhoX [Thermomicrobiales bacterium]